MMYNEFLALLLFVTFIVMVLMYRCFGKQGLIAWVAIGTIIANIQVIKTVDIFGISATLGNVMFASIYLATDILNDIYGRKVAKRAVWLGFSSTLVMIIVMQMSLHFIPAPEDISQKALSTIFDLVPNCFRFNYCLYYRATCRCVHLFNDKKFSNQIKHLLLELMEVRY